MNRRKFLFNDPWFTIFSKNRNALVFETKNKDYGAYALRKNYAKTLFKSYCIAVIAVLLLIYTPVFVEFFEEWNQKTQLTNQDLAELNKNNDILLSPPPLIELNPNTTPPIPEIIPKKQDTTIKKKAVIVPNKDSLDHVLDSLNRLRGMPDTTLKTNDTSMAQRSPNTSDISNHNGQIQMKVDALPEFPGGENGLMVFMKQHIKYSLRAKAMNTQGTVNVAFIVEADGSISGIRMLMIASNGLDDEVIDLIKAMPRWKPGIRRGKPQRFVVNLPVNFYLKAK